VPVAGFGADRLLAFQLVVMLVRHRRYMLVVVLVVVNVVVVASVEVVTVVTVVVVIVVVVIVVVVDAVVMVVAVLAVGVIVFVLLVVGMREVVEGIVTGVLVGEQVRVVFVVVGKKEKTEMSFGRTVKLFGEVLCQTDMKLVLVQLDEISFVAIVVAVMGFGLLEGIVAVVKPALNYLVWVRQRWGWKGA
jgi:hypothetical protein